MYKYLFLTNKPDVARYAECCGVNRIFIDLEIEGKAERQGHLDTVISSHSIADISQVKKALKSAELLVRINPFSDSTQREIDAVIDNGADIIMLPMFREISDVKRVGDMIGRRVKFVPLVETIEASKVLKELCDLDCVDELHIGLNDLHLEFKLDFMFELLSNDYVYNITRGIEKPYGVGGISRVGTGKIPGEMVMAEHMNLSSSGVILSREFHLRSNSLDELKSKIDLKNEITKLNAVRDRLASMSKRELVSIHDDFVLRTTQIVEGIRSEKAV